MTLPASGALSMSAINTELGRTSNAANTSLSDQSDGTHGTINIANLNEAIDITRKRGFNRYDPNFTEEMYEDITSENYDNIDDHLGTIAVKDRAIALEQHYGSTIDFGFRFSF